jgi:hypothetical protein
MPAWTLEHPVGRLQKCAVVGTIDVGQPEAGLQHIHVAGQSIDGRLLCVLRQLEEVSHATAAETEKQHWPLPLAEAYVRGDDLVASYEPIHDWPYSPQIYWRARGPESSSGLLGGVTVLLSVHTHLLDTWPRISVESNVDTDELLFIRWNGEANHSMEHLNADCSIEAAGVFTCVIHRLAKTALSYAELLPATDFRQLQVWTDEDGTLRTRWNLFAEFLEKGVIRRARVHSAFLSRENDVELARQFCEVVARESLPLTT